MDLQTARTCSRKAVLNENLSSEKNKFYTLSRIINEVLLVANPGDALITTIKNVEDAFSKVGVETFSHEFEMDSHKKNLIDCFDRYLKWEKGKIVKRNISDKVTIPGRKDSITTKANWLIDRGNFYHLVKFFRGNPALTYKGRTINTNPAQNTGLYCLQLLGESLKLNKPVIPCFHYLKSKNDKSNSFVEEFEKKEGDNVIAYFFNDEDKIDLSSALKDITFDVNLREEKEDCRDCTYSDICNTEFVKRELPQEKSLEKHFNRVQVTKEQETLITAREGIYSVNAVAGSGKTSVIALRTLSLLEEDGDPEKILMITFTDKARGEMKSKIKGYAKAFYEGWDFELDKINIETFNSWGSKIINMHYRDLGFSQPPIVIDDLTKRDIVVSLLEKHPKLPLNYEYPFMDLPYVKGAVLEIIKIIDKMKADNIKTIKELEDTFEYDYEKPEDKWFGKLNIILDIYNDYNQEIVNRNVIDYEDQLRLIGELKPLGVLKNLQYENIIIDEFQDSNSNQLDIIEEMIKTNNNIKSLVVVGDAMQAIYGFRNTSPENLINFTNKFNGAVSVDLSKNFRSQSSIIDLANKIIKKSLKSPKYMKCSSQVGNFPKISIYKKYDEMEISLLNQIKEWKNKGIKLSDMAVLARTKNELIKFQKLLIENGHDAVVKVPEVVKDNPYVKSIFSLTRYLMNNEEIKGLSFYAKSKGINPFDKKEVLTLGENLKTEISTKPSDIERVESFYRELDEIAKNDYLAAYFVEKVKSKNYPILSMILSFIKKYDIYDVKDTFTSNTTEQEAVTLITVHSSKGLEYPNVILSLEKFKDNDEESRLLYVGVTRAKKELLILIKEKQWRYKDLLLNSIA